MSESSSAQQSMDSQVASPLGSDHRLGRRVQRGLAWCLSFLVPVSTLLFGTVHAGPRAGVALASALVGAIAFGFAGRRGGVLPRGLLASLLLGLGAGIVALFAYVPVGAGLRQALQPAVAGPVLESLALSGRGDQARALALDAGRGTVELASYLAMVLVVAGTAVVVRNRPRARRLALLLVATGVGVTAVGLVQRWTGADHVFWTTDVPLKSTRPFFGPFVNPNHAGTLLAAVAPAAVALLYDRRSTVQLVGAVGGLVVLVGALACGSRGAIVLLLVGVLVSLALAYGRQVRVGITFVLAACLFSVLFYGPVDVADWLTGSLDPGQQAAVAAGYQDVWSGRGELYRELLPLMAGTWRGGVGPAGFDDAFRVVRTATGFSISESAHQELVQAVIEHGLLATLLALAALGPVVRALFAPDMRGGSYQARLQAAFGGGIAVIVCAAMYELPLRAGALAGLAAVCAGAVLGLSAAPPAGDGPPRGLHSDLGRRVLAVTGLALVMGLCGAWLQGEQSTGGLLSNPSHAIDRGRAALAAADIDRAVWERGGDTAALDTAVTAFQDALWARPVDRIALQELARLRFRQGRADDARQALDVATHIYPSLPWPWRDLARLAQVQGDYKTAWARWADALALDLPPDFPIESWLEEALRGPGGAEVAALAVLPDRADRWEAAARVLDRQGKRAEAEVLYREAVALDPALSAQLAFALLRWGRADDALAALPEEPKLCGQQRARAEALRRLSRCDEGMLFAERALATCGSEGRDVRLTVARLRLCLGDERALGVLEALVREEPDDHGARRTLARALADLGKTDEAKHQLEILEKARALRLQDRELLDSLSE